MARKSRLLTNLAYNEHPETVKSLLASGADIEGTLLSGATPLYMAAFTGHPETVRVLLAGGVQIKAPFQTRVTPTSIAALNGHPETARVLLAHESSQTAALKYGGVQPRGHSQETRGSRR